jgi:hypothetical protein
MLVERFFGLHVHVSEGESSFHGRGFARVFYAALAIAVLRNTHQPVGKNIFRPPPSNFENPSVGTGGALLSCSFSNQQLDNI